MPEFFVSHNNSLSMSNSSLLFRMSDKDINDSLLNLKHLLFEVTDACNLKCKYCVYGEFYSGYEGGTNRKMSFKTAKVMIDHLASIWEKGTQTAASPFLSIGFYGGEPLLNFNLIKEIIEYSEQTLSSRRIYYSMTTNAMLLDRYMDYLVEKGFSLLISLDGKDYEDSYRVTKSGKESFQRVMHNVKLLQKRYPSYFKSRVSFNTVLHNRNDVDTVYDFMMDEFEKKPRFSEISDSGVREDQRERFTQMFRSLSERIGHSDNPDYIKTQLFENDPSIMGLNIFLESNSENVFSNYNELLFDYDMAPMMPTGTCLPFSKKLFLTVNGDILQCERIPHKYKLGRIIGDKVLLDTQKIVDDFNKRLNTMQLLCESCFLKDACPQCMYNIIGLDEGEPQCIRYMNKEQYDGYVSYYKQFLYEHPFLYRKITEEIYAE